MASWNQNARKNVEVACGVMRYEGRLIALAPVEIIPRERHESAAGYLTEEEVDAVRSVALSAHEENNAPYSCVRCVVSAEGVLRVGSDVAPPLTVNSAFVRSASVAGFTAPELTSILESYA